MGARLSGLAALEVHGCAYSECRVADLGWGACTVREQDRGGVVTMRSCSLRTCTQGC